MAHILHTHLMQLSTSVRFPYKCILNGTSRSSSDCQDSDVCLTVFDGQLLDLITGWDWSSYLHDVGIEGGKYALVTPRDAATLLEKLKEAEQKSSVFSVLKKNERDRRKLLDTVLKQLKQLQTQDGS